METPGRRNGFPRETNVAYDDVDRDDGENGHESDGKYDSANDGEE